MTTLRDLIIDRHLADSPELDTYAYYWPLDTTIAELWGGPGWVNAHDYGHPYDYADPELRFRGAGDMVLERPSPAKVWDGLINDDATVLSFPSTVELAGRAEAGVAGTSDSTVVATITDGSETLTQTLTIDWTTGVSPPITLTPVPKGWSLSFEVTSVGSGASDFTFEGSAHRSPRYVWRSVGAAFVMVSPPRNTSGNWPTGRGTDTPGVLVETDTAGTSDTTVDVYINDAYEQTITVASGTDAESTTLPDLTSTDEIRFEIDAMGTGVSSVDASLWLDTEAEGNGLVNDSRAAIAGVIELDEATDTGPVCNAAHNFALHWDAPNIASDSSPGAVFNYDPGGSGVPNVYWTRWFPQTVDYTWALEFFFQPDPDMATTEGFYSLFSYRNAGVLGRHLWWAIEVAEDGSGGYTYSLRRRSYGAAPGTGTSRSFPSLCFGRWNQLVIAYTAVNATEGGFSHWSNGRKWFDSGAVTHGGETPPSITRNQLSIGYDALFNFNATSDRYPFWGRIAHFSLYQGTEVTDAEVNRRWRHVASRCGQPDHLREV